MDESIVDAITLAMFVLDISSDEDYVKKSRNEWTKKWLFRRPKGGFYAKFHVELRDEEPNLYRNFFRMNGEQFDNLLDPVTPIIRKQNTVFRKSICPGERLAITLRYLATGDRFHSLQYLFRVSISTISKIIPEVVDAIYEVLFDNFLKAPSTSSEWKDIASKFNENWNFPHCIGAVDGRHMVMNAPPHAGSVFYNYKGTHSIILMGIADAEYKLLYVDVGRNGIFSDGVFNRCSFGHALDTNMLHLPGRSIPYLLVGDDAKYHMIKPGLPSWPKDSDSEKN